MTRFGSMLVDGRPRAFREEGAHAVLLDAADVADLLRRPQLQQTDGERRPRPDDSELLTPIARPGKIVCVGLNYHEHAREVGKQAPAHPTLFAKFATALVGPGDDIELPAAEVSEKVDWEAELVIVVGRTTRDADESQAADAVFGYTAMNDVSVRDWQKRTEEWLQGKTFDRTTPLGPVVVTADEVDVSAGMTVATMVNGDTLQNGSTSDLIFTPVDIVRYITSFMTLEPGDIIATGTPAGVGAARSPQRFLADGDVLVTEIEGVGRMTNRLVRRGSGKR